MNTKDASHNMNLENYPFKAIKSDTISIRSYKGYQIRFCKVNGHFYVFDKTSFVPVYHHSKPICHRKYFDVINSLKYLIAQKEMVDDRKALIGKKVLVKHVPYEYRDVLNQWQECKIAWVSPDHESFNVKVRAGNKWYLIPMYNLALGDKQLANEIEVAAKEHKRTEEIYRKAQAKHIKLSGKVKEVRWEIFNNCEKEEMMKRS